MLYTVVHIDMSTQPDYQRELVYQALADIGFEAFDGDDAYIQTSLLDEALLSRTLLLPYRMEQCPDENWNATWEAEHEVEELPMGIRITPHCAFGAGHHETTRMMVDTIIERIGNKSTENMRVLDMGTGTGVLGIYAARLGAAHVLCVDIDDKSTDNALENAAQNNVHIEVLTQGTVPDGEYDLILANIHRNILLQQMPDYARTLSKGGELYLSGFYEQDVEPLCQQARQLGLHHLLTKSNGEWRMMVMEKKVRG